ncbi:MAG: SDR family NAD(P)-dependent oxidoreductase [Novosphingobium sp.]
MDFTDRHVVITGASSGIGLATARKITALGGRVTLIARREALLVQACAALGERARFAVADVADKSQLEAALDGAVTQNGEIDGLFLNAAAGGQFAPITEYPEERFEHLLTVNVRSLWWTVRHVLPAMQARGSGAILITGSLASERGVAGNPAYVIAKHAARGVAMSVAAEVADTGIRCNIVIPGFIDTDMLADVPDEALAGLAARTPQGRIGKPEEVANVAAFLLSDLASHVTAQGWAADGGVLGTLML